MSQVIEQPPEEAAVTGPLFTDLELTHEVQLAVQMAGYLAPTPIQAEIIPFVLDGRDIVAQSQTGTGKTAAFALPILSKIEEKATLPQVLVLAPTRELATQVAKSFETYGSCMPKLKVGAIFGGADYEPQLRMLKRGVHVVVGTPGRVLDHIRRVTLKLDGIRCLVLDEADEMLNMGFIDDVEFVLKETPAEKQVALFSATLPAPIREIANTHLKNPQSITIKQKTLTAESIDQRCIFVEEREKKELLARLIEMEETDGIIVFTKTKESTLQVSDHLSHLGLNAAALNGDLPQARRQRTVDQLKSGRLDIIVATDVAARGLDVQRISHVFNYDLPHDGESYVHRIGRTGRAGKAGVAFIFLTFRQRSKLRLIERVTKQPIKVLEKPTAREINLARVARFKRQVVEASKIDDLSLYQNILTELVTETGQPVELLAAGLAHLAQGGRPLLVKDMPKKKQSEKFGKRDRFERESSGDFSGESRRRGGRPNARQPEAGMQRYWIGVGHADGVRPGNIVGAVANEAGISGREIGSIDIRDNYSTIDLPDKLPGAALAALEKAWVSGKQLRLRPYRQEAPGSRPKGGGRPSASGPRAARGGNSAGKRFSAPAEGEKREFKKNKKFTKKSFPKKHKSK